MINIANPKRTDLFYIAAVKFGKETKVFKFPSADGRDKFALMMRRRGAEVITSDGGI